VARVRFGERSNHSFRVSTLKHHRRSASKATRADHFVVQAQARTMVVPSLSQQHPCALAEPKSETSAVLSKRHPNADNIAQTHYESHKKVQKGEGGSAHRYQPLRV